VTFQEELEGSEAADFAASVEDANDGGEAAAAAAAAGSDLEEGEIKSSEDEEEEEEEELPRKEPAPLPPPPTLPPARPRSPKTAEQIREKIYRRLAASKSKAAAGKKMGAGKAVKTKEDGLLTSKNVSSPVANQR
jgi:hypothetical protein